MDLILPAAQLYAENYTSPESDLLREISEFTKLNHSESHMLSGHIQGKFLQMVSLMIRPHRILEIGTFTGYSALCLAQGLLEDGELHTIEIREEDARTAQAFFSRSVHAKKIHLHHGNASEILQNVTEMWDLAFIDADKPSYTEYFNLVFPRLRKNGFILADNIFFHGQVFEENPSGKSAKGIRDFNNFIAGRNDIEKVVLTIRDGLYLIRKL
jgi:caffeoyl-CoA O-methyltransferase